MSLGSQLRSAVLATVTWCVLALAACGSDTAPGDDGGGPSGSRGYVRCGDFTCSPGQYCENFVCLNGCTSDDNCKEGTSCHEISSVTGVGTCTETTPRSDASVPLPSKCGGKFAQLVTCGLIEAWEVPTMEQECAQKWPDTQVSTWDACVQAWAGCVKPIPTCLQAMGLECGPSFPCPTGTCATVNDASSFKVPHQCY